MFKGRKVTCGIDDLSTDHREVGGDVRNLLIGAGKIIVIRYHEIGELPVFNSPLGAFLVGEPSHVFGPHAQCGFAV